MVIDNRFCSTHSTQIRAQVEIEWQILPRRFLQPMVEKQIVLTATRQDMELIRQLIDPIILAMFRNFTSFQRFRGRARVNNAALVTVRQLARQMRASNSGSPTNGVQIISAKRASPKIGQETGQQRLVSPRLAWKLCMGRPATEFRSDNGSASGASSSMVEQRAFNPLVQGSSPWGRTSPSSPS
jgi:hypothetical protein